MSKLQMSKINREQLKRVLKERGLTQKKLCEIIEPTDQYPGGLSEGYLSRCLKNGEISAILREAIAKSLDVSPLCLSSETDYLLPYSLYEIEKDSLRNNIPMGKDYAQFTQKEAMLEILLRESTLHQVELSNISQEDQEALRKMIIWTALYFLKGKGYLDHTKAKSLTEGQLLDHFHEIMNT